MRPLLFALTLAALPVCAQPGGLRFHQPLGDDYEARIRVAPDEAFVDCDEPPVRLFDLEGDEGSLFDLWREGPDACGEPPETFSLWHDGVPVDSVGGFRFWLGAALDTLMWEDLAVEDHPVPDGAVQDLTGDGVPEMIVASWSGGAHCCYSYLVVELGEAPRLLLSLGTSDSEMEVRDSDGDGFPELHFLDFSFAYWNTSFAGSPAPAVVLAWDGEGFAPSPRHMAATPLDYGPLAAWAAEVRADESWTSRSLPPETYWGTLLDLLYAGRGAEATRFAEDAWPGDALGRSIFLGWFSEQLWQSPYIDAVREMNRDAVPWL